MLSAVDRSNVVIMESAVLRNPRRLFELVNRNHRRLGFQFYGEAGLMELAAGSTGELVLKEKGKPDDAALAYASSWTTEGEGASRIYWFEMSLFGTALAALFPTGTDLIKNLVLQLKYTESGRVMTPPPVACTMHRRYFADAEGTPDEIEDYPPAADVLVKTAQTLTTPEKDQVVANLSLAARFSAIDDERFIAPLDAVTVAGSGTVSSDGSYTRNGNAGGRAAYAVGANTITWNGSEWELYDDTAGFVTYFSSDDVSAPWLASTWSESSGDAPAPSVTQATGTIPDALAAKADRDDLLLKADASDLALKADDNAVVKLAGTQTASAMMNWTGRQQLTGQPSLPASTDAMTRDGSEFNRIVASPLYRDLFVADRTTSGTGVTGTGTYAVEGRSGGFFSAGDATSAIYCAGISTTTGYSNGGNNLAWSYVWWQYFQFEAAITTNAVLRITVGLRTDTTSDISTVSGNFAGVEWSSATSVRGFGASGSTPTVGSGTTSSTIANVRNHVWFRNNANGTISAYHATGFAPRLPSSPLLTISGAPTGNGGAGFQFLLKGTGASASGSFQSLNSRLIIP